MNLISWIVFPVHKDFLVGKERGNDMKHADFRRAVTVLLSCGMLLSAMSTTAFAGEQDNQTCTEQAITVDGHAAKEPVTLLEQWPDGEGYGYRCLTTDGQRTAYQQMEQTVSNADKRLQFEDPVTPEELEAANEMFLADHPEYFWYTGSCVYHINGNNITAVDFLYVVDGKQVSDVKSAKKELEKIVEKIIDRIPKGLSEYETALYLHDVLARRVSYERTLNDQTAYGALVEQKAVCAGYARAYQLLMKRAGLDAWTVTGYSYHPSTNIPVGHAWNLVWIDKNCFYVDVTWDDQGKELFHEYFVRSLAEFEETHILDEKFSGKLPACDHERKEFFEQEAGIIAGVGGIVSEDSEGKDLVQYMVITKQGGYTCAKVSFYYTGKSINEWLSVNIAEMVRELGFNKAQTEVGVMGREVHLTISSGIASTYTLDNSTNTAELHLSYSGSGLKAGETYQLWAAYYSEDGQMLGCGMKEMVLNNDMCAVIWVDCPETFDVCRVMVLEEETSEPLCYSMQLEEK